MRTQPTQTVPSRPAVTVLAGLEKNSAIDGNLLSSAIRRLADRARQPKRDERNEVYYGIGNELEEKIHGFETSPMFDGIVTRNHYGSLVLNANRAMFIDIDLNGEPNRTPNEGLWSDTFADLCTVLSAERGEGFRIYRTAAGFRVLGTANEFLPGSNGSQRLMNAVGADSDFMMLCARQNTFRARLTPKPWRCGLSRPPVYYPRTTQVQSRCFSDWLAQYEHRCRDRATCRFLADVGHLSIHERIASIIELHDRETKALANLPLA